MNELYSWMNTAWARTWGWSLLHFLWEGMLISLLLAAVLRFTRTEAARLRYASCCLALLAMPLALGTTAFVLQPAPPVGILAARPLLLPAVRDTSPGGSPLVAEDAGVWRGLPWVAPLWLSGVLLFYVRSLAGWMAAQRLRRTGVCMAPREWQHSLEALARRLGLAQRVGLLESCRIDVPVVIGVLRPVILMPMGLVAGLPTAQVESILLHELAHIRRSDYVVNLLQSVVEGLLFYHPATWWVSAQIRAERENCCDDVVVRLSGDARGYAAALARLEQNRWPAREPVLAATGGSLMKRIRRLLGEPEYARTSGAPVFAAGLLVVSMGVALAGWQSKPLVPAARPNPAPIAEQRGAEIGPVTAAAPRRLAPEPLVAQAQTAQEQVPAVGRMTERQKAIQEEKASTEPASPYQKWMTQDVAYIISDQERAVFKNLPTNTAREAFIKQFWLSKDPTPATVENEYREEHYRRIAYANDHFSDSRVPGWKTDRGMIYIVYGPPDEINSHPSGGEYRRPAEQGGGVTSTFPFEQWRYRYIEGIGNDVLTEFVDRTGTGEYHLSLDPNAKDALLWVPGSTPAGIQTTGKSGTKIQVMGTRVGEERAVLLSVPLSAYGDHQVQVSGRILTVTRKPVQNFESTIQGPWPLFTRFVALAPGSYRLEIAVKDTSARTTANDELVFEVK